MTGDVATVEVAGRRYRIDFGVFVPPPPPLQFDAPNDRSRWHTLFEYPTLGYYLDRETLQRSGGRVTAWTWGGYADEKSTRQGTRYDRALSREEFDCSRRRTRALEEIFYRDGENVRSYSHDPPTNWSAWAPETDGELIGEAVCAYRR